MATVTQERADVLGVELLAQRGELQQPGHVALDLDELARLRAEPVPAGTIIMAVVLSANRDPAVFADPDRLDISRGDMRHLGFGGGVHACVGAALARLETRIAITALLAKYPRIELAVSDPDSTMSWVINGVTSLPVNVS